VSEEKSALELKIVESVASNRPVVKIRTYKVETMCLNCCSNIKLELPLGIRVKGQKCPTCECKLGEE
jgi:hypothetical protein